MGRDTEEIPKQQLRKSSEVCEIYWECEVVFVHSVARPGCEAVQEATMHYMALQDVVCLFHTHCQKK